ncbi:Adenylate kinase [Lachnospiraceae bacterium XBB1006]|nr:Adenylate kinase [Lachnospiraceae bacterium XBB1006]
MNRVMVIGCPGGGKSTFSRALHEITGIPLVHLDMLNWNADKTTVGKPVFRQRLADEIKKERWIIDGNYGSTIEMRLKVCDTVFFLDYSVDVCLKGALDRRGKERTDLPWVEDVNEEDSEFLEFIKNYNEQSKPQVIALLEKYADKEIHIFKHREEAEAFLKEIGNRRRTMTEV